MKLNCEQLQDRCLPSVTLDPVTGVLTVTGTAGDDGVYINTNTAYMWNRTTGQIIDQYAFNLNNVTKIVCNLGAGNDSYYNGTWISDLVHGEGGNDYLVGGDEAGGTLYGDAGQDLLDAGNCDTFRHVYYLDGGADADTIQCCFGPDVITYDPLDTVLYFNAAEDSYNYGTTSQNHAIVIDNIDSGFSAPGWTYASGAGFEQYYGSDESYLNGPYGNWTPATWSFGGLSAGTYRVSATYTAYSNRATDASYSITDGNGMVLATKIVNQQQTPTDLTYNGSQWVDLGTVTVTGSGLTVALAGHGNGFLIADAVRIEKIA